MCNSASRWYQRRLRPVFSMSEGEDGPERVLPLRITIAELAKIVQEQMAESRAFREENRTVKRELERLKGKLKRGENYESENEEVEQDENAAVVPPDQRPLLQALERMGVKGGEIPTFHGRLNPDECIDWLEAMDSHFECDHIPPSQKVKIAKTKLKGAALSWWNFVQNERAEDGKEPITTWKRMRAEIKRQFVPEDYEILVNQKLHNLKQRDLEVFYSR